MKDWTLAGEMMEEEDLDDPTVYFERQRIQQLKDERIHIQKKTFTKWCNSFLTRVTICLRLPVCPSVWRVHRPSREPNRRGRLGKQRKGENPW